MEQQDAFYAAFVVLSAFLGAALAAVLPHTKPRFAILGDLRSPLAAALNIPDRDSDHMEERKAA